MSEEATPSNYMIVSCDSHAGADLRDYKPYLASQWHDQFDKWAAAFHDPWNDLKMPDGGGHSPGQTSGADPSNWDNERRIKDLEADGIAGEVIFPNTAPPFYPSQVHTAPTPRTRDEYEHRWAGLKAHNRWLVDFCSLLPGRRAGIAQIMLNDVDDAVAEIEWAKEAGLTGGILLPAPEPSSVVDPLYSEAYDPIWAACASLEMPVNQHSVATGVETGTPASRAVGMIEVQFFSNRALWHLIFGGAFERHPRLKYVITEQMSYWIPEKLKQLDNFYYEGKLKGSLFQIYWGPAAEMMSMPPSAYFKRNCYIGGSFMLPVEGQMRHELGVERMMWGQDYPHGESTFPYSREALRATFADVPVDECRAILGENAARLYSLDPAKLRAAADRIGPTVEEIAVPLDVWPSYPEESRCAVFANPGGEGWSI